MTILSVLMILLDQVQAPIMVVVVQDKEELPEETTVLVTVPNDRKDLDKLFIREVGRERSDSVNKVESFGSGSGLRSYGWRGDDHQRARAIPLDLEGPTSVGLPVLLAQRTHDGKPDLGVQGQLVPKADTLKACWLLDRILASEKPREELPDANSSGDRIQLGVQDGRTGGSVTYRVGHVQDLQVGDVGLVDLHHQTHQVANLAFDLNLPITTIQVAKSWQTGDVDPVLLRPIGHPIGKLRVDSNSPADSATELRMIVLDERKTIIMRPD